MKTSIIILTYNKLEYTKLCIDSIRKFTQEGTYEIIVVDNNSSDGTIEWLKEQKDIKCIFNKENAGFPKGCNQGINIASGNNIMLLNNDTVVTQNWLENLLKCLYSSLEIGAVGPITNNCAYYQNMPVSYKDTKEMLVFAENHNISNNEKWEERLKLIGFCILMKREIVDKIGLLDECFSPGNYEDDDYSIRIIEAGYKLMFCKDTFIHHFGNTSFKIDTEYSKLLKKNEEKFKKKWGFCTRENMNIYFNLVKFIDQPYNGDFKVLELGCGCGATLLQIHNKFKNAKLYGIDKNESALKYASKYAKVINSDFEYQDIHFEENYFDYILIGDLIHKLKDPTSLVKNIKKYLKQNGKLLISIPNEANRYVLFDVLKETNLRDKNKLNSIKKIIDSKFYNCTSIYNLLSQQNFKNVKLVNILENLNESEKNISEKVGELLGEDYQNTYKTIQYVIIANKEYDESYEVKHQMKDINIDILIKNISKQEENSIHILNLLKLLNENEAALDKFLETLDYYVVDKVGVLNSIAINAYENQCYDFIIPMLQKALEYEPNDKSTIMNLSNFLTVLEEYELALRYLENIEEKDTEVIELIGSINRVYKKFDERETKFLLRRIENNIEFEESLNTILNLLTSNIITETDIIASVSKDIIEKENVLNTIAVKCFEEALYEYVIPFLQKAYEINECNENTIFNLGFVLNSFGEKEMALEYLKKLQYINDETQELISSIEGELKNE